MSHLFIRDLNYFETDSGFLKFNLLNKNTVNIVSPFLEIYPPKNDLSMQFHNIYLDFI